MSKEGTLASLLSLYSCYYSRRFRYITMNKVEKFDTSSIPLETLETIRNRLNQVHLSLRKLFDQLNHHNRHPTKVRYPSYQSLQSQFQILLTQLHTLTSILDSNDEQLKSTNVYPLPTFPAAQQENLLTTLLRKKPLPEIDEWIDNAILKCKQLNESTTQSSALLRQVDEFAKWCSAKVEELQEEFHFYGFQTAQELEYSTTEEGEKEKVEKAALESKRTEEERAITDGDKKPLTPNQILKFMFQDVRP